MEATANKIDYWLNTSICEYYDDDHIREWYAGMEEEMPEDMSEDDKWELAAHMRDLDLDDFWGNLKYSKFNTYCIITGTLGLWNGRPEIRPVVCTTLEEALHKCFNNMDDAQCYLQDGVVHAIGLHHDGRNHFEIRILKDEFIDKVDEWCAYESGLFPFDLKEIAQYVDYLY